MGFQLRLVVSSPVSIEMREAAFTSARTRWPFIRGPRDSSQYVGRIIFAPPEMTGYLFDSTEDEELCRENNFLIEDDLPVWSRDCFPDVTFAFIETDCFGGNCQYAGYCCRNGEKLLVSEFLKDSLLKLTVGIGIPTNGPFQPFVRGFFAGRGSGGFA